MVEPMVKERSTRRASGDEAEGTDLPVEKGKFLFKAAVEADGSGGNPAKGRRDERWRRVLVRRVFGSACVWFGMFGSACLFTRPAGGAPLLWA